MLRSGASRWMMAVSELFNARFRVINFETQSWSMWPPDFILRQLDVSSPRSWATWCRSRAMARP